MHIAHPLSSPKWIFLGQYLKGRLFVCMTMQVAVMHSFVVCVTVHFHHEHLWDTSIPHSVSHPYS